MRDVYVESLVGAAYDEGSTVWTFDLDLWGTCAQGRTAEQALERWTAAHGPARIMEEIRGDEQAFRRDEEPAGEEELAATLRILRRERTRSLDLLETLGPAELDLDDPDRTMPSWATWRTIRQTLWHICDTESRYYLPRLGLPGRERRPELDDELRASHDHVLRCLNVLPRARSVRSEGEVWTSTKLLRRLAWHERGELEAIDRLVRSWRGVS